MNAYKTLSAGIAAATIVGAVGFAYAQTNDATNPVMPGTMPADSTQTSPAAMPSQPAIAPADSAVQRGGRLSPADTTMQRPADSATTRPPAMTRSPAMAPSSAPSDSATMAPTEPTPKADRN